MRVELEAIDIAPPEGIEAATVYRVLAIEDTGTTKTLQIGTVTHVGGPTWSLMLKPEGSSDDPLEILLTADTLDDLKGVIRDRFGLLEFKGDRLADETMAAFVGEMLRSVSTLATKTKTISGFTSSLVYHLALVGALDIRPERREKYVERVTQNLRDQLADIIKTNDARGTLTDKLRAMLDQITKPEGGGDGSPTQH